jgi:hypothetical protein
MVGSTDRGITRNKQVSANYPVFFLECQKIFVQFMCAARFFIMCHSFMDCKAEKCLYLQLVELDVFCGFIFDQFQIAFRGGETFVANEF